MRIGYARLARLERLPYSQLDALRAAGCERVLEDHGVSAMAVAKPGLEQAVAGAQPGDTLVVCSLDRLARNLSHLIALVGQIQAAGLHFASIADQIDTLGEPVDFFRLVRALEHFERGGARDRRLAIEANSIVGRKSTITDAAWASIKAALVQPKATISGAAAAHSVSRQAIYARLEKKVSDAAYVAYRVELANGADRAPLIERLGLYPPAIDYRDSRVAAAEALTAA